MTSPVPGINPATRAPQAAASTATSSTSIDPQAFLQLLVTQLQYQDPTSPADMSSFMQQTATLSQVQTMTSMSTALTSLLNAQQMQAATDMIGRSVTYLDSTGARTSGVVSAATLGTNGATLDVGGVMVSLSQVLEVSAPSSP